MHGCIACTIPGGAAHPNRKASSPCLELSLVLVLRDEITPGAHAATAGGVLCVFKEKKKKEQTDGEQVNGGSVVPGPAIPEYPAPSNGSQHPQISGE